MYLVLSVVRAIMKAVIVRSSWALMWHFFQEREKHFGHWATRQIRAGARLNLATGVEVRRPFIFFIDIDLCSPEICRTWYDRRC